MALALAACANTPPGPASGNTSQQQGDVVIRGTVMTAPTCPVERVGTPCPPQPAKNALVEIRQGPALVATTIADAQGRYSTRVLAGDYEVRATNQSGYPSTVSKHVSPRADIIVDLVLDSGIRTPGNAP